MSKFLLNIEVCRRRQTHTKLHSYRNKQTNVQTNKHTKNIHTYWIKIEGIFYRQVFILCFPFSNSFKVEKDSVQQDVTFTIEIAFMTFEYFSGGCVCWDPHHNLKVTDLPSECLSYSHAGGYIFASWNLSSKSKFFTYCLIVCYYVIVKYAFFNQYLLVK